MSSATRLAEQAVSTVKLGPSSPQLYEKRLETSAACCPVAVYGPTVPANLTLANSPPQAPTNTPTTVYLLLCCFQPAEDKAEYPTCQTK